VLRGNLSTRPFYNERLVTTGLALAGLVALALTAFNVLQFRSLSEQRRELQAKIDIANIETARIRNATQVVYASLDRPALQALAGSAEEANRLIDARVFSWSRFLNSLEAQMPMNVHLVSVSPRVERGVFQVELNVVARTLEDLQEFVNALARTDTFYDVFPTARKLNDDGTIGAAVRTGYREAQSPASAPENGAPKRGRP
jgi:hypothetical protein